ncbi:putative OPT oligopeptide transporter [Lepidopterella palustris CBS 459.81]|uniref:Putative OPT oligopeptide transporter n=1 Tax=Lepidopterella palustris CBS 459.81 TaxID=1314670 RepID=A0A8E2EDL5_9PEZI|nr:putative OPT oligopeptide transporter [Lepidopterella palustris CBS 459.81]
MTTLLKQFSRRTVTDDEVSQEFRADPMTANDSQEVVADDKQDPEVVVSGSNTGIDGEPEEVEEDLKDIPLVVRRIVSLEDDTNLPTLTFRYFLLTFLFTAPGAVLYQMGMFWTTLAPYSILFVQISSHYAGVWLAKILPATIVRVPFTRFSFSLNPGLGSIKEHILVTVSAASGATSNAAWTPISLAKLYYGDSVNAAAAIFFMWSIVYIGYAMAAPALQFLLYDPIYPWPYALMQTALFETMKRSSENSRLARRQKNIFFIVLGGVILWQFLPEYVFPFVSSLSFLCWVAPKNQVANFIGGGIGGMGLLNLSLDWSNISNNLGNPMIMPFWTSVILFAAYVFNCWMLLPAAKWGNLGEYKHGLMSNRLFLANGSRYPVTKLIGPNNTLNETAYKEYGPVYMGTQQIWGMFFDYSSYISALTWMALFGFSQIRETARKLMSRAKSRSENSINHFYNDRLNVIQRSYKKVPLWWYLALFIASFTTIIAILAKGLFFIPIWTFFYMLQDQKIEHYMHVPPRDIFFSQIFGELIGVPINYAIVQWVLSTKGPYLLGEKSDPLGQWTGQSLSFYNTLAAQYVLVGPPPTWAFVFGAGAPLAIYILHRLFPRSKFNLWNVTIFASGMSQFYGNLSVGYISRFIVGYISMRYIYRKRFETWRRYNFQIAAACDVGFNIAMLLMFIFFSSGKVISMPNWWGNNAESVECCFALDD